jgi:protein-tyrosine phosphatase
MPHVGRLERIMGGSELSLLSSEENVDLSWVTERLAVGGAIWTRSNIRKLADAGVTHIVDLQPGFDDSKIAHKTGISVLWSPFPDDFQDKPPELFEPIVDFALSAYQDPHSRIYFHCLEGVHRSPLMLLAFLGILGMKLTEAMLLICQARPQAEFPAAYRRSVVRFLARRRDRTK